MDILIDRPRMVEGLASSEASEEEQRFQSQQGITMSTRALSDRVLDRMRWPAVPGTVPGSLPVVFFGDLPRARVATVGINPSLQEYLTPVGIELDGEARRLETLRSLGVPDRAALSSAHSERALERMIRYFDVGRPVYRWFAGLARVMEGFGEPFQDGSAAHLDLIQEATAPTWSRLREQDASGADALLKRDLEFLRWQVGAFRLQALLCTSALVTRHVFAMLNARVIRQGEFKRLRWTAAVGDVGGRPIPVVAWNIPLNRPTGLTASDQQELGALLAREVAALKAGPVRLARESRDGRTVDPTAGEDGRPPPATAPVVDGSAGGEPEDGSPERAAGCVPLLVHTKDAARALGISLAHFHRLVSTAMVPRPVRLGRRVLWRSEELKDWVRAGCPPRDRWEASQERWPLQRPATLRRY